MCLLCLSFEARHELTMGNCVDNHVSEHLSTELPTFKEPLSLDTYGRDFITRQSSQKDAFAQMEATHIKRKSLYAAPRQQQGGMEHLHKKKSSTYALVENRRLNDHCVAYSQCTAESNECTSASQTNSREQCEAVCPGFKQKRQDIAQSTRQVYKQSRAQRRASVVTDWETMEILREAFESVDLDGEGKIDLCGLTTCFRTCGLDLELDQTEKLFAHISNNGEYIDFNTLREYLTNNACGAPLLNRVKRVVQKDGADKSYLVYSMVRRDSILYESSIDLASNVLKHHSCGQVEKDAELLDELIHRYSDMVEERS